MSQVLLQNQLGREVNDAEVQAVMGGADAALPQHTNEAACVLQGLTAITMGGSRSRSTWAVFVGQSGRWQVI